MKKIKVMQIIARLNIGGPAVNAVVISEGLKREFDTRLVAGDLCSYEGDMSYLAREKNIELTIIPELKRDIKLLSDIRAFWKLFRLIRKERPDIVHTHTAKAGALGRCAAILNGVPVRVHTFHGHIFEGYFNPAKAGLFIFIEKLLARFTSKLLVVSDAVKDDICVRFRIADEAKVAVAKIGLDIEEFKNTGRPNGGLREELGAGPNTLLVGIVGRLAAVKNHHMFLETIAMLKDELKGSDVRFVIIGDGELRSELEAKTADLGIKALIYFAGWRRNMPAIYGDLDMVVLTSVNEGTPLSIIEAMASGKAIAATGVGGVPDLIEDQKTGLLVGSGDTEGFRDAVLRLLKDKELRAKLGNAASLCILERYNKQEAVETIGALYKKLLKETES